MELTLESALSPGGLLGNASYILLILSMAMRRMFWLRCLAILSGLTGIAYDAIWLKDPVGTFWESAFTLTNLVQWLILIYEDRKLQLTGPEKSLHQKYFPGLDEKECKQLMALSEILTVPAGTLMIRQGQVVDKIYLLLEGGVGIVVDGRELSRCGPGDFLGEMSFLSGNPATADAVITAGARVLAMSHDNLARVIGVSSQLSNTMSSLISRNLTEKLQRQNRRDAELSRGATDAFSR